MDANRDAAASQSEVLRLNLGTESAAANLVARPEPRNQCPRNEASPSRTFDLHHPAGPRSRSPPA